MHRACVAYTEHVTDTEHALHALSMRSGPQAHVQTPNAGTNTACTSRHCRHRARTWAPSARAVPALSPRARRGLALPSSAPPARCGSAQAAGLPAGKPQLWDRIYTLRRIQQRLWAGVLPSSHVPAPPPEVSQQKPAGSRCPKGFGCPARGETPVWGMRSHVDGPTWGRGREAQAQPAETAVRGSSAGFWGLRGARSAPGTGQGEGGWMSWG